MTRSPMPAPSSFASFGRLPGRRFRAGVVVGMALLVAVAGQVLGALRGPAITPRVAPPAVVDGAAAPPLAVIDTGSPAGDGAASDTDRIRANIAFWSKKLAKQPTDFVAAEKLGESQIDLGRSTGDLSAYEAADAAFTTALRLVPDLPAALAYRGVVLVSLHRFDEARDLAETTLRDHPDDPTALATLGDASLELGDVGGARKAYDHLADIAPGASASVRLGHLAFIVGDTETAVREARAAARAADADEETSGERAAFYHYQLADVLLSTGDRPAAERAYREALTRDPGSFLAHAGLGRALAADGDLDAAIDQLTAAIAIVPQPDMLARRADLYALRSGPGDAARSDADRKTVLAIAQLSSGSGAVYDRTLALYLANHDEDVDRALALAQAEIGARKDVYGYDTLAWTLLKAGRPAEADAAMRQALAFGTRDAKLLYHAGMIAAALGDPAGAERNLRAALELDPSFDALQAQHARELLQNG